MADAVRLDSALVIQRAWRRATFARTIRAFRRHHMTLARAKRMDFPELVKQMQAEPIFKTSSRLLGKLRRLMRERAEFPNPTRVFLTSFMIAAHPSETLPSMGANEMVRG